MEETLSFVTGATDPIEWLRAFEKEHGRPLRVLHVGNVANNAYLNAKWSVSLFGTACSSFLGL